MKILKHMGILIENNNIYSLNFADQVIFAPDKEDARYMFVCYLRNIRKMGNINCEKYKYLVVGNISEYLEVDDSAIVVQC